MIIEMQKRSLENLDYDFDFSGIFPTGDNIASVAVSSTPTGLTLGTQVNSGQIAKQYISSGSDGVLYKIVCKATSTAGRIAEQVLRLTINDEK